MADASLAFSRETTWKRVTRLGDTSTTSGWCSPSTFRTTDGAPGSSIRSTASGSAESTTSLSKRGWMLERRRGSRSVRSRLFALEKSPYTASPQDRSGLADESGEYELVATAAGRRRRASQIAV